MRTGLLLAATALALSACAATAQGASTPTTPASHPSSTAGDRASATTSATAVPTPLPTASPDPEPAPDPEPSPWPTPSAEPGLGAAPAPAGSFVLGDSISLSPGVGPVLGRYGYPVVGLVGQSVSDGYLTTYLSSPAAQLAPGWVIELGTNNAGGDADVARLEHWVDLIDSLRTQGRKQHVRWVTPYRPADSADPSQGSELDAFNAELARLATTHHWLRLLDFATLAKANPDWFALDALRVHPDAAGQAALVSLVAGTDPVLVAHPVFPFDAAPKPTPSPSVAADEPQDPTDDQVFDNGTLAPDPSPAPTPQPSGDVGATQADPSQAPTPSPAG